MISFDNIKFVTYYNKSEDFYEYTNIFFENLLELHNTNKISFKFNYKSTSNKIKQYNTLQSMLPSDFIYYK